MISGFNNFNNFNNFRRGGQIVQQQKHQEVEEPPKPQDPGCPGIPGVPGDPKDPKDANPDKKIDIAKAADVLAEKCDKDDWTWAEVAINNNGFTCIMPPAPQPDFDVTSKLEAEDKLDANAKEKMTEIKEKADDYAAVKLEKNDSVSDLANGVGNDNSAQLDGFIDAFQNGDMSVEDFIAKLTELGATNINESKILGPGLSVSVVIFEFNGKTYQVRHTNHMQTQGNNNNNINNRRPYVNMQAEQISTLNKTAYMAKNDIKAE